MLKRLIILMLLLGPSKLQSLDLTPWYGQDKLLKLHSWATYQYYPTLDTAQGTVHQANNNLFVGSSLSIASNNKYAAEIESSFFRTNLHTFSMENVRITVRRQWLNDIVGDPFTLVTGATITAPSSRALHDYNTIYHGKVEIEGHAALGRECASGALWNSRWWGALALGKADQGCPWLRGRATWEKNFCNQHQCRVFAEGAGGSGHKRLTLNSPFLGYGKIAYRTLDAGAGYSFLVDDYGKTITAEYSYRIFGRNAPMQAHNVTICIMLPIGF